MSQAFLPLGPNYLLDLADDSSLATLQIADNNAVGATWQVSNLDSANVAYVQISTEEFDGGAIVPGVGVPGQGTAILPKQSVFVTVNITGIATGNVFVSGAVTGTATVILVPGLMT